MVHFCTVLHETDENGGYLNDQHFIRDVADMVRGNHRAANAGYGFIEVKNFPKEKQARGMKLRQLLYLLIVVFKAKLVLHRPQDNCNSAKKKKTWSKYNHIHLLLPECKNTKPNKMCKWQQVTDLTDYMKLHFSTMEKVSTLSGMVKYLSKPPRTDLGPCLDAEIEHEFELCQNATETTETSTVMF